ncbi:hypothetical protein Dimus_037283 [Dionaea muscipula]
MASHHRRHRYLPGDLIFEEILWRLPVKSLVRFKTVCKEWCFIISSTQFAKSHLLHTTADGSPVAANWHLLAINIKDGRASTGSPRPRGCRWDEGGLRRLKDVCAGADQYEFSVLSSSNGLVLIMSWKRDHSSPYFKWYICNPTLDVSFPLPMPKFVPRTSYNILYGFGYMPSLEDYRAALIPLSTHLHHTSDDQPLACVFSLASATWDIVEFSNQITNSYSNYCYGHRVPLNNAFHWILTRQPDDKCIVVGYLSVIKGGDQDEQQQMIKEILLPTSLQQQYRHYDVVLGVMGGCLCVAVRNIDNERNLQVWSLKRYGVPDSWINVFEIDLRSLVGVPPYMRFVTNFQSIVNGVLHAKLINRSTRHVDHTPSTVLFDLNSNPPTKIFFGESYGFRDWRSITVYMETLVLPAVRFKRERYELGERDEDAWAD